MKYGIKLDDGQYKEIETDEIDSFGIELEGNWKRPEDDGGDHEVEFYKYLKQKYEYFEASGDGTIYTTFDNEYKNSYSKEFKYWVYNQPAGIEKMYDFLRDCYKESSSFNASCGLHIHFKTKDDRDNINLLNYFNVKLYVLQKYIDTYMPYISKDFDGLFKDMKEASPEIDNSITSGIYANLENKLREVITDNLNIKEGNFSNIFKHRDGSISDIYSIGSNSHLRKQISNINIQNVGEHNYNILKYGVRLFSSYCEYLGCISYEAAPSHYNFLNTNASYSRHGNFEFRLMPYADTPEQAMDYISFTVNTMSEAIEKVNKRELDGWMIDKKYLLDVESIKPARVTKRRKTVISNINENYKVKLNKINIQLNR